MPWRTPVTTGTSREAGSPRVLETHAQWRSQDVANPESWTVTLSGNELEEIHEALRRAEARGVSLIDIRREDFPLPQLSKKLQALERELIDGRGFALLRGVERERYSQAEMELLYWGIGMHLGEPWPQNRHGHVLGDVTDQGKSGNDPTSRGNEIGRVRFPYHSDGSDLVGLMCLQTASSGGTSTIANAVAIHNDLVREAPELAAALYLPQPFDFRGEEPAGGRPWYEIPVFSDFRDRLFTRYIPPYIRSSQRHAKAPRIHPDANAAMERIDAMCEDPSYNVFMDLEAGDMQFVNNYHVLHARTAYEDNRATGRVRHLKRLWLETRVLEERPSFFASNPASHWATQRSASHIQTA